ncbi:MAG: hypothetical protein MJY85_00135 [Fibrobacter sp.]|nr:hypothetical protein [Fibrobacter sp.]
MTNRFMNIIDSANLNKEKFDDSMESLKDSLECSVKAAEVKPSVEYVSAQAPASTGWLRGSLSYPWVLICTIAPVIEELF